MAAAAVAVAAIAADAGSRCLGKKSQLKAALPHGRAAFFMLIDVEHYRGKLDFASEELKRLFKCDRESL